MLNKLSIKNVALISDAQICFTDGFNVMSGETGSGKSVVIESLNFVLGAKADKTLISSGADACYVSAEFDVSGNESIYSVYDEFDFERDDLLIISRKLTADGKNGIKVNGNTVNLTMLKRFTSGLVDVHGQSEHYELLSESNQLKLLDKFGGEEIARIKERAAELFVDYKNVKKQLEESGGSESQRLLRLDVLEYQINEITKCDLKENEEDELLSIREILSNQEKIVSALSAVKSALSDEGGVSDVLSNACRSAGNAAPFGKEYADISDRLQALYAEAEDVAETVGGAIEDFDYSEYDPDEIESRLETIKSLKKKYGNGYKEINEFLENAVRERDNLINYNELNEKLSERKRDSEEKIYRLYSELNEKRRKAGAVFSEKVVGELTELGMDKARFEISFSDFPDRDNCDFSSPNGADKVKFLFSANQGEELKPLSGVISGGEISRFMLAVKAQSAKYDDISTYIFDEIDAGISGKVAGIVAKKLYKISLGVQVIAITHLPQISAFSDNSVYISKSVKDGKTVTEIKTLSKEQKVEEIMRLVGGSSDNRAAREHSENLIAEAEKIKTDISQS